ncbi:unnamed protein product [Closterium sp. NIES-53]
MPRGAIALKASAVVGESLPESEFNLTAAKGAALAAAADAAAAAAAGGAAGGAAGAAAAFPTTAAGSAAASGGLSVEDLLRPLGQAGADLSGLAKGSAEGSAEGSAVAGLGVGGSALAGLKKQMRRIEASGAPDTGPLPTVVRERLERKATYEASSKEAAKWLPLVHQNRQAPSLNLIDEMPSLLTLTLTHSLPLYEASSEEAAKWLPLVQKNRQAPSLNLIDEMPSLPTLPSTPIPHPSPQSRLRGILQGSGQVAATGAAEPPGALPQPDRRDALSPHAQVNGQASQQVHTSPSFLLHPFLPPRAADKASSKEAAKWLLLVQQNRQAPSFNLIDEMPSLPTLTLNLSPFSPLFSPPSSPLPPLPGPPTRHPPRKRPSGCHSCSRTARRPPST